ncbi:MAG TPA: bifunctional 5,10-methylenetetrahydrofolate dehydrogenase/5,10-methenyltetrahydrofolate cyclohydrolase [Syntrophomonadaceae bacterium]|nr:bifunctional 5,10-methylenetetrahydrofolate dehydrogenase/5,10-methenyltetrahydrofolate cyclohydrolase [Syntrophomonadaceae bacterium]
MKIINGGQAAGEIKARLAEENRRTGLQPCLAVILIGDQADSSLYVALKEKAVQAIGGRFRLERLDEAASSEEVLEIIEVLNQDPIVDGIILQLPLPTQLRAEQDTFLAAISPAKDVDGFHPQNRGLLIGGQPLFISCAALACLQVIEEQFPDLIGKRALLAGDSFDLILPLTMLLLQRGVRVAVHPSWHDTSLEDYDLAVIEKGQPHAIREIDYDGPVLLIDAGFYMIGDRTVGNIDGTSLAEHPGWLLPVPGGLGPLLIAKLMDNLTRAAGSRLRCKNL